MAQQLDIDAVARHLHEFAEERDWVQYHTPKNLAMALAAEAGACFGPSGAGGGDVAVHVGLAESSPEFRARAESAGLRLASMRVAARGIHRVPDDMALGRRA